MKELEELILKAEREGLWLESTYQRIAFSPYELRQANSDGRFRWGPCNWDLIDPRKLLINEETELQRIRAHNNEIRKRISR